MEPCVQLCTEALLTFVMFSHVVHKALESVLLRSLPGLREVFLGLLDVLCFETAEVEPLSLLLSWSWRWPQS